MPLIAEVPGKQPSLYIETEARTRERIGIKLKMKRAYLNIGQKSKSTVKANFAIGDDFFLSRNAFALRKAERREVLAIVLPCFNKELLFVFYRNVPTAQSCSSSISKLSGKRTKTLCCGSTPVSHSINRHENHGSFS